jgi:hypothetical protein
LAIEAVDKRGAWLNIKFHPGSRIEPAKLMSLVGNKPGAQFTPAGVLRIPLPTATDTPAVVLEQLKETFASLA